MCVRCGGGSRDEDGFVAFGKLDIKPGNEGVSKVVTGALYFEVFFKGEIGFCDCIEIYREEATGFGRLCMLFNSIYNGLEVGNLFYTTHIKSINIIPEIYFFFLCIPHLRFQRYKGLLCLVREFLLVSGNGHVRI